MSTHFQAWGSTLSTCPDPTMSEPEPLSIVGYLASGKPVEQGRERVLLTWNALSVTEYADLYNTWNTNKDSSGSFDIPDRAATSVTDYRTVTAYAERPLGIFMERHRGRVTMRITIV